MLKSPRYSSSLVILVKYISFVFGEQETGNRKQSVFDATVYRYKPSFCEAKALAAIPRNSDCHLKHSNPALPNLELRL